MDSRSTGSSFLLLERPTPRPRSLVEGRGRTAECGEAPEQYTRECSASAGAREDRPAGLGFLLRAPGLALLAVAFLIEGYRWLGVIHLGTTWMGSLVFGTVGLALMALAAPVAALVLTSGRQASGWVVDDIVSIVAVAVTVATGTTLVVGGSAWRAVAGTVDLALAASALGAVILGERDRRRAAVVRTTPVA